ncbi:hypothetical protein Tco_0696577 [Tanacetum coccineum]
MSKSNSTPLLIEGIGLNSLIPDKLDVLRYTLENIPELLRLVMEENKTATLEESEKLFTVLQKLHDDLKLCNCRLENADGVFEGVNARAFNAYSSSNGDQKA